MITIYKALSWLNQFEPNRTCLKRDILASVMRMNDAENEEEVNQRHEEAMAACRTRPMVDAFEYAEIKLNCAAAKFCHRSFSEAGLLINEAIKIYSTDHHRRAVALWALGIVEMQASKHREAYIDWQMAIDLFQEQIKDHPWRSQPLPVLARSWYLKQIREMELELFGAIESVYGILNEPEQVQDYLTQSTKTIIRQIETEIRNGNYAAAYELIKSLLHCAMDAPSSRTYPEALIFSGLAAYEMRNAEKSIEYFTKAANLCLSYPHQRGVALWMQGLAQWHFPHMYSQAIITWQNSLEIFTERANQSSTNEDRRRYKRHIQRMKAILNERTEWLNQNGPPDHFSPPENVLIPTIR